MDPHIIDRREQGSGWSRAVGILPRSMDILEASGVAAEIRANAVQAQHTRIYFNDKEQFAFNLAAASNHLFMQPQADTETMMKPGAKTSQVPVVSSVI